MSREMSIETSVNAIEVHAAIAKASKRADALALAESWGLPTELRFKSAREITHELLKLKGIEPPGAFRCAFCSGSTRTSWQTYCGRCWHTLVGDAVRPSEPETETSTEPSPVPPPSYLPQPTPDADAIRELVDGAVARHFSEIEEIKRNLPESLGIIVDRELGRRVDAALIQRKELTIRRTDGTVATFTRTHKQFEELLAWLSVGQWCYLYGAPGGGKTTVARQCAEALGTSFHYLALSPQTLSSRVFGFVDAHGNTVRTPFREAYEFGGVFLVDEFDNCHPATATELNGAIENRIAAFPDGMVEMHPDFVIVATGNTAGTGGSRGHAARMVLDDATRDRFAFIEWQYDEQLESALALEANPDAGQWIAWVRKLREFIANDGGVRLGCLSASYRARCYCPGCGNTAR